MLLCVHHKPAVEGGIGDDGDVRGELAPDPAKRKHRNVHGDQSRTLGIWPELGPTTVWESAPGLMCGPCGKRWGGTENSGTGPMTTGFHTRTGMLLSLGCSPQLDLFKNNFEKSTAYTVGCNITSWSNSHSLIMNDNDSTAVQGTDRCRAVQ